MDHRRRVTCWGYCMAVCTLWIAAAGGLSSTSIPKVFPGTADRPTSTTVPHSTANTVTSSRAFNNASGAPAYTTTETASLPVGAQVPTPLPGQVMPSDAPLAPPTSSHMSSSPAVTTTSQRVAGSGPTLGTTHREEMTPPPYVPPAAPSRPSTVPTSISSSTRTPVQVEPAEKNNEGDPNVGEPTMEPKAAPAPPCDYNPCVHLQRPCPELQALKAWNCRCPGDPSMPPGPVVALQVTRVWPTAAGVRWCAPGSAASAFLVWVLRGDGSVLSNGSVSSWTRQTDVFGLAADGHVYTVCVSARNSVGAVSHKRCVPVTTAYDAEALAVYVLSGASCVLLVAAVVLSLCLYRQCERRGQAVRHEATPLNHAAHAFHDPLLTCSMVSIANPAYAPPAEEQVAAAGPARAHRAPAKKPANVR